MLRQCPVKAATSSSLQVHNCPLDARTSASGRSFICSSMPHPASPVRTRWKSRRRRCCARRDPCLSYPGCTLKLPSYFLQVLVTRLPRSLTQHISDMCFTTVVPNAQVGGQLAQLIVSSYLPASKQRIALKQSARTCR
eukprot:4173-Amphidinium_carterae.3